MQYCFHDEITNRHYDSTYTFSDEVKKAGEDFIKKIESGKLKLEHESYGMLTEEEKQIGKDSRREAYLNNLYKNDSKLYARFINSSAYDDIRECESMLDKENQVLRNFIFDCIDEQDKTLVLRK